MVEAPIPGPSHSSPPAPMETGRAGDGQSWADQAEASAEAEFQQARLPKHPHSQSRRWDAGLVLPFPLQDSEGRLASVMRFYEYAAEQLLPLDDVAGEAIRHMHSHMLPRDARHLRNQVVCMIAEYHLTSSARVLLTLSPVLLEAAKPLLPALKTYIPNISFEGTRDVRLLDHAKALQVAVWLHRLDMSTRGDEVALEMLDASQHCLECLLESFLGPATHGLLFREVVVHCLYENQRDVQHRVATRSTQKRIKKDKDLQCRDLESLKARISHEESHLQEDSPESDIQDDPPHRDAEAEMPPNVGANNAPSEGTTAPVLALLLVGTLLWRLKRGLLVCLPPVLSLGMMMTFSLAMSWPMWKWAWPTSPSHPPVDKMSRERKPHTWRHLPLQRMFNCRTDDHS